MDISNTIKQFILLINSVKSYNLANYITCHISYNFLNKNQYLSTLNIL